MKKYNILFWLVILFFPFLTSCSDEVLKAGEDGIGADGKITITMSMSIPSLPNVTRGIEDGFVTEPTGSYLQGLKFYVFVFEDNGAPQANYLRELAYGDDVTVSGGTDHNSLVSFKVKLDGTAENAILHIVATKDSETLENQLQSVPDRSELGLFAGASGLYTSNFEAYWKRIELDSPITADSDVLASIKSKLTNIKAIRNFLKFKVRTADPESAEDIAKYGENNIVLYDFQIDAFTLCNAIDKGYIGAYNENLGADNKPGFVEFEEKDAAGNLKGTMRDYRELVYNENYIPERHPASERQNPDEDASWTDDFERNGNLNPKFMFERSIQDEHKSFVIIKGHFGTNPKPLYFKLDIGSIFKENGTPDPNSAYGYFETYQLLRNFSYDIVLTKIVKDAEGHESAASALGAPSANNISASIETRPLVSIEDGVDRMAVNKTTWVIVDDDNGHANPQFADIQWIYETYYLDNNRKTNVSNEVKWNFPGYELMFENGKDPDGIFQSWGQSQSTSTPGFYPTNESTSLANGWREFRLNFSDPDNVTRQKTIRLYRPYGLTRDITFIMHKRWEFVTNDKYPSNIEVYPGSYSYDNYSMPFETLDELRSHVTPGFVGSQRGAQLTVMFELPEDLPEAIFPLDFKIGFDRQNVENAYIGNAAVNWGPSMFPDEGKMPRMQFVKTVSWQYYQQHKIVTARFLTTTEVLDESMVNDISTTRVCVENPYFTLGNDTFERSVNQTDTDPTRRIWYWNFSAPEWASDHLPSSGNFNAGTFNELYHANGSRGDHQGTYMKIGPNHGDGNPEFWFNVGTQAYQAPFTARVTVRGASDTPKSGTKYYRRELVVKATILRADGTTRRYEIYGKGQATPTDPNTTLHVPSGNEGLYDGNGTNSDPKDRYFDIPVNAGEILERIDIWSNMHPGDDGQKETNFYSIKLELN